MRRRYEDFLEDRRVLSVNAVGHFHTFHFWTFAQLLLYGVVVMVDQVCHKMRVSSHVHVVDLHNVECIEVASGRVLQYAMIGPRQPTSSIPWVAAATALFLPAYFALKLSSNTTCMS